MYTLFSEPKDYRVGAVDHIENPDDAVYYDQYHHLVAAATSNDVQALWIHPLEYTAAYEQLFSFKLVQKKENDFILISSKESIEDTQHVASIDTLQLSYMLSQLKASNHKITAYPSYRKAIAAFEEKQVDGLFIPASALSKVQGPFTVLSKLSDFELHFEYLAVHQTFTASFSAPDIKDDSDLVEAIRWLYSNNLISSRYYPKDFIYQP